MSAIKSHKDLDVWQLAMRLAEQCYAATKAFPRDEMFGQTAQIRRAAVSIAANIAEGFGRESTGAFIQFLRVAQGSQKELEPHLLLSERVQLLPPEGCAPLLRDTESVGRMLRNLIRSLESRQHAT
jgi:four helix bundle protein